MKRTIICTSVILLLAIFVNDVNCELVVPVKDWWEHAEIYQIYPRSFKDSNGDGVGDLNGITSKLSHLNEIGVNTIWLSPIFQSPNFDFGYDVSNYLEIDPAYGTLEDFGNMMTAAKALGIRILLDFVPNHSSHLHEWFVKSKAGVPEYANYYVWADPKFDENNARLPPNNWISVFGNSAWEWVEERGQYYLHQFSIQQPDLNFREQKVVKELEDVLIYWLERGVDGFRFDAINHMFETVGLPDEPSSGCCEGTYDSLDHIHTKDVEGVYEIVYSWRKLLEDWRNENGGDSKIIMTEAYTSLSNTMRFYEDSVTKAQGANMPFNFWLIYDVQQDATSLKVRNGIETWLDSMPAHHTPDFVLGSHDHSRIGSRLGEAKIDLANILLLTLPGCSITYYGEEIGMVDNNDFTINDGRDPERTPMQWDTTISAGFSSSASTWLPVNSNFVTLNVESQRGVPYSHIEIYKSVARLRDEPGMMYGDYSPKILSEHVFAYTRELRDKNADAFIVVFNFNTVREQIDLTVFVNLPTELQVAASTRKSEYINDEILATNNLKLAGNDAIVLRASYQNFNSSSTLKAHVFIVPLIFSIIVGLKNLIFK